MGRPIQSVIVDVVVRDSETMDGVPVPEELEYWRILPL